MVLLNLIFQLAAGIGMFLFAMYLIEESLKNLSGRNFKLFLQRRTKNSISAVGAGATITAILQSSSMVSLMVLAFLGAGVFTMQNALAIILGANLGTTISGWIVATLGFKMNIEVAAYPIIFIGGIMLMLLGKRKTFKYISFFLLGFGLLFVGLSFMKTGMENHVSSFDFSAYADMPLIIFLLMGFVITSIVQSSPVTMALTLSALHVGAVSFPVAAAIVLGSETGTTLKILLASIGGNASKKRVATGNFLFNLASTIVAFILLKPILLLISDVLKINDHLIGLVTFSTFVNLISIIIFLPLLNRFSRALEKLFTTSGVTETAFIGNANLAEPETALDLFKRETEFFIYNSMIFNLELFGNYSKLKKENSEFELLNEKRKNHIKSIDEKYIFLKQVQGKLQAFYLSLRNKVTDVQNAQLNQIISSVRSAMHSIKSMKDISSNIANLRDSTNDVIYNLFVQQKKETEDLYEKLNLLIKDKSSDLKVLHSIFEDIQKNYSNSLNNFYKDAQEISIDDSDISTALNLNRELFTSNKAMLMAVKDFLFEEKEALRFNDIQYRT